MCVGSSVFSTTRLNLDISVSMTQPLSSSSTMPQRWCHALESPSSITGQGTERVSPGDLPR
jgi:hypothetical protein